MQMRTRILAIIIGCALCRVSAWPGTSFQAQQDKPAQTEPPPAAARPHSVWDGAYTEEQAKRGDPLYHQKCASCHGDKLTGGESAPPLTGGTFLSNWNGLTLDVLFERIRTSMPSDNPAKVGRGPKADILAYILSQNRFPAGSAELQSKAEMLKDILIESTKPSPSGDAKADRGQK
jgi:mono/diheme cytochrome c family protein